ncbi:CapA family protein [Lentibacillus salicampi]|uniref:CapA family protein n=1 Tax=Lentibacillus salicampi TaxID=175306 RepID=A0A4Y9AA91_9BACI|nr:CapA family protein [Lentibacillus salicampi]TFJ91251.1 CapA family protein [Lentibacillus salicampi]
MSKINLVATGDVLLHSRIYNLYKTSKDGYDFTQPMAPAKKLLSGGDISVVNLESPVAGEELGLQSFPKFNNPVELAENLKKFGTDLVTNSNNHTMDLGVEGALKSIENLEKTGLMYVGSHKSKKDRKETRVIEKNGIKCAFLSYTAVTLGNNPPKNKEYLLNRVVKGQTKEVRGDIERVKKEIKPDVVIVSMHFGREYPLYPVASQKEVAASISDAGADIIIGHHPHVLQPAEWITNSRGKQTFVIYSLGNFYSGQKGLYRQIGGSLSLDVIKEKNTSGIKVKNPKLDLTFVDANRKDGYQMYHLLDYIEKNAYIKTAHGEFDSLEVYSELSSRYKNWMPEIELR